jgi:sulfotransferase family protein
VGVTKPNFLIAGTAKAGTTSLHDYLSQHPDVYMSTFKEPNYFVPGYAYDDWTKYLALFADARGEKAVGESSTGYLQCEESPALIKSALGNVKIILMLRNPARRAASLYWWMVREGYEDAPSFAKALELEPARMQSRNFKETSPELYVWYFYCATGLYSEQVRRFLETFGSENVRIYLFEEFARDPLAICREIFDFLEVDPTFKPTIAVHNEARIPASARLQFWLRTKAPRYLRFVPGGLRRKLLALLMALNTRLGSTPQRDLETESRLLERYRDDIRKLEQLLDRDLSIWFSDQATAAVKSEYVSVR